MGWGGGVPIFVFFHRISFSSFLIASSGGALTFTVLWYSTAGALNCPGLEIMTPFCILAVNTGDKRCPLGNVASFTLKTTLKGWKLISLDYNVKSSRLKFQDFWSLCQIQQPTWQHDHRKLGSSHMVREGKLRFTKKTVGGVKCFGPVLMNEFTPM